MTSEEFVAIRDDQSADCLPMFYFYYNLKGGIPMSYGLFGQIFFLDVYSGHIDFGKAFCGTVLSLNKHFGLSYK